MRYTIDNLFKEPGIGEDLIDLDQVIAFDTVDHLYAPGIKEQDGCNAKRNLFRGQNEQSPIRVMQPQELGPTRLLPLVSLLLILQPILHKLGALRGILRDLGCGRIVLANMSTTSPL